MTSKPLIMHRRKLCVATAALALTVSCGRSNTPSGESPSAATPSTTPVAASAGLPASPTGYYGVYTASNVVLFGKFVRMDEQFLTISDVHYIRSNVDPEKKQVANQLIKRVREWHEPKETSVARSHILVLEAVAENSRMMALIQQTK